MEGDVLKKALFAMCQNQSTLVTCDTTHDDDLNLVGNWAVMVLSIFCSNRLTQVNQQPYCLAANMRSAQETFCARNLVLLKKNILFINWVFDNKLHSAQ
jgi:hypothetical protein